MGINSRNQISYGFSQALTNYMPQAIVAQRSPLVGDLAPLGQIWVDQPTQAIYILSGIAAGQGTWLSIAGGGAGVFTTLTVTGNATVGGTLGVTGAATFASTVGITGNTTVGGTLGITGNTTIGGTLGVTGLSTLGSLAVTTSATVGTTMTVAGASIGQVLRTTGDAAGVASTTQFSNVVNNTQSSGALTLVSSTANAGTNAGFLKIYVGTTTAFIPYFTNIAP